MLALIAGTGDLPPALVARLPTRPLICALAGFQPALDADLTFRLEHLGSFLSDLRARGVTHVCLAGAVQRPHVDPSAIDAQTAPLMPIIQRALASGDDGALRALMAVIEDHGLIIVAAHDIAPDLLPPKGVLTRKGPSAQDERDAVQAQSLIAEMGKTDTGQACVVSGGRILAREGIAGTDAMLADLSSDAKGMTPIDMAGDAISAAADWLSGQAGAGSGILYKAPKPQQDRRADLPVIGPGTARAARDVGLAGIVIAAGGVMVLDRDKVIADLDAAGMFLWVRA